MVKLIFLSLILLSGWGICLGSAPTPGEIERSQELIQQEEAIRAELGKTGKVFVKEITVTGAVNLSADQIKTATLPFIKKWLGQEDIQQIIDLLGGFYREKKLPQPEISHQMEAGQLKIVVKEKNP